MARGQVPGRPNLSLSGLHNGEAYVHAGSATLVDASAPIDRSPRRVRLNTLGCFELTVDEQQRNLADFDKGKAGPTGTAKLLAYIAHIGQKRVSPDRLLNDLWPDAKGGDAGQRALFSKAKSSLTKALEDVLASLPRHDLLIAHPPNGFLYVNEYLCVDLDAARFERAVREVLGEARPSDVLLPDVDAAEQAMQMYRGGYMDCAPFSGQDSCSDVRRWWHARRMGLAAKASDLQFALAKYYRSVQELPRAEELLYTILNSGEDLPEAQARRAALHLRDLLQRQGRLTEVASLRGFVADEYSIDV